MALSFALLLYFLLQGPAWVGVAIVAATLLPAGLILYGGSASRRARELRRQQTLLLEQREVSEREHDRSEESTLALQHANLDLEQRLAELMTLNELGVALSSTTMEVDELLDSQPAGGRVPPSLRPGDGAARGRATRRAERRPQRRAQRPR